MNTKTGVPEQAATEIVMPDWNQVAAHYDNKGKDDLNYLSAVDKRIVHHHSGVFDRVDHLLNREYREEDLLQLLGASEDRLTHLGAAALGISDGKGFDCGCGRGGSSLILARDYGHSMLGITISRTQLDYARIMAENLNLQDKVSFEQLNIYHADLSGLEGQFDFIWACESTEYMPDYITLFTQWHKLLKRGGKALIFAITCRKSQLDKIENELRLIDEIYETKIGSFDAYLQAAISTGFEIDDLTGLEEKIIPYYKLRLKSVHKRGSEEALLKGLENGYFKYSLFLLRKV